jgi:SAM-dependent methyltransferase
MGKVARRPPPREGRALDATLAEHYEGIYRGGPSGIVRPGRVPRDRHEACVLAVRRLWRGGQLLELGAGSGIVARSLIAGGLRFDGYTVTDASASALAGLEQSLDDPRVRAVRADAERVPEAFAGRFDAVVMVALIEHLVDPVGALRRVRACLRPGGFAYVDTPNIAKFTRRLKLLLGHFPSTASRDEGLEAYAGGPTTLFDEGHLHYFTYRSLSRMLVERCGFARVEKLPYCVGDYFGPRVDHALASAWPALFGEIAVAAWA